MCSSLVEVGTVRSEEEEIDSFVNWAGFNCGGRYSDSAIRRDNNSNPAKQFFQISNFTVFTLEFYFFELISIFISSFSNLKEPFCFSPFPPSFFFTHFFYSFPATTTIAELFSK